MTELKYIYIYSELKARLKKMLSKEENLECP